MRLCNHLIGSSVLVRSRGSGVWMGTLLCAEAQSVSLEDARRLHRWSGAGECTALALYGPGADSPRIGPKGSPVVHEVLEVHPATDEAMAALARIPEWTAR